jgi:hypothetical protein
VQDDPRIPKNEKNNIGYTDGDQIFNKDLESAIEASRSKALSFCKPAGCCDHVSIIISCSASMENLEINNWAGKPVGERGVLRCNKRLKYNCNLKSWTDESL